MVTAKPWFRGDGEVVVDVPPGRAKNGGGGPKEPRGGWTGRGGGGGWGGRPGAGGGSGLTLIGSLDYGTTPSDSDDFDITGVDEVLIVYHGLTTPGDVGVRLSDDGGSTFYDASGDYLRTSFGKNAGETDIATTWVKMILEADTAVIAGRTLLTGLQAARPVHSWTTGNRVVPNDHGMSFHRTKDAIVGPFNRMRVLSPSGDVTAGHLFFYKRE